MIGFIYFKKKSFKDGFIAYIPKKGWVKSSSEEVIKKYSNVLFITNVEDISDFSDFDNVKNNNYFDYDFEKIIYYFNASKLELKHKIKLVSNVLNEVVYFFQKNFKKEIKLENLQSVKSFHELYDTVLKKENELIDAFPSVENKKFQQLISSSEQEFINFYLKENEFKLKDILFNVKLPLYELEYVSIKDLGEIKDVEQAINMFSQEYFLVIEGALEHIDIAKKRFLPKRMYGEKALFLIEDLVFLKDYSSVRIEGFYISSKFEKLKNQVIYSPSVKKTCISNRIVWANYIKKIFDEIDESGKYYLEEVMWAESYRKVCALKDANCNVIAYTKDGLIASSRENNINNVVKEVEKLGLLYSADLISYLQ